MVLWIWIRFLLQTLLCNRICDYYRRGKLVILKTSWTGFLVSLLCSRNSICQTIRWQCYTYCIQMKLRDRWGFYVCNMRSLIMQGIHLLPSLVSRLIWIKERVLLPCIISRLKIPSSNSGLKIHSEPEPENTYDYKTSKSSALLLSSTPITRGFQIGTSLKFFEESFCRWYQKW